MSTQISHSMELDSDLPVGKVDWQCGIKGGEVFVVLNVTGAKPTPHQLRRMADQLVEVANYAEGAGKVG